MSVLLGRAEALLYGPALSVTRFEAGAQMLPLGEVRIGKTRVGVLGFEGLEGYLFVLFDPTKRPDGHFSDSYSPASDFGYLWFREENEIWVASGIISVDLVGDSSDEIDRLIDFIADDLSVARGEQVASSIDVVEVRMTKIENGEWGHVTFRK